MLRIEDYGADRRPADRRARRPRRLDRLALLPALRLGRLLRRAARRPSRTGAGCSRPTGEVRARRAPLPRATRSSSRPTSTPTSGVGPRHRLHAAARRRARRRPDRRGRRGHGADADGARDPLRLRLDRARGCARADDGRCVAIAGPDARRAPHAASTDARREPAHGRRVHASRAGERVPFVLTWHPSHQRRRRRAIDPEQALRETVRLLARLVGTLHLRRPLATTPSCAR